MCSIQHRAPWGQSLSLLGIYLRERHIGVHQRHLLEYSQLSNPNIPKHKVTHSQENNVVFLWHGGKLFHTPSIYSEFFVLTLWVGVCLWLPKWLDEGEVTCCDPKHDLWFKKSNYPETTMLGMSLHRARLDSPNWTQPSDHFLLGLQSVSQESSWLILSWSCFNCELSKSPWAICFLPAEISHPHGAERTS